MKTKLLTIVLSIIVFFAVSALMIKPAYTNPDFVEETIDVTENVKTETKKMQIIYVSTIPKEIICSDTTIPPCKHTNITNKTILQATCTNTGLINRICDKCNEVIEEVVIEKEEHKYKTEKIKATCSKEGKQYDKCKTCGEITNEQVIQKTECEYEFINKAYATPFQDGEKIVRCKNCNWSQSTTVIFEPVSSNSIYIPTANINKELTIGVCNQEYTDKYDITIDYNFINSKNPVIFGHNTRTLGRLNKTKVGDCIYLIENGVATTYKVTHSEPGLDINGGTNVKGINTGKILIDASNKKTIHIFTCYWHPTYGNIRWIVIAEAV